MAAETAIATASAIASQAPTDAVAAASASQSYNFADSVYYFLQSIGFTHPLHTVMTHLVIGPIIAAFLLGVIGLLFKKDKLFTTAKHLNWVAFAFWFATVGIGIIDWFHYFSGANDSTIAAKLTIAGILLFFIVLAIFQNRLGREKSIVTVGLYGLMTVCCIVLGLLGGDLVGFGENKSPKASNEVVFKLGDDGYSQATVDEYDFAFKKLADQKVSMRLSVKTNGWIAVGFGQTGTMKGSDMYLGYVKDDGAAVLEDHFGYDTQKHKLDIELKGTSDVSDIVGTEKDGVTTLTWTIPLNSADKNDIPLILGSSYKFIFAKGPAEAKDDTSYHGRGKYAISVIKLVEAQKETTTNETQAPTTK